MSARLILLVAALLFVPLGAGAQDATYNFPAVADTYVEETSPDVINGNDLTLRVRSKIDSRRMTLISFDVSSIPADEVIVKATFHATITRVNTNDAKLYRMTADWDEGTASWNNTAAFVDSTLEWGSIPLTSLGPVETEVTALVQAWRAGVANHGIVLVAVNAVGNPRLASRENSVPGTHPYLVVETNFTATETDVQVLKTVKNGTAAEGDTVQFVVRAKNLGPGSTSVRIEDPIPTGLSWITNGQTQGAYDPLTGNWDVGTIAAGDSASLTLVTRVDLGQIGRTITNWAWFEDENGVDSVTVNDADSASVLIVAVTGSDLQFAIAADDSTPNIGQALRLLASLQNAGPDDATGIAASVPLPAGLTHSLNTPSHGSYDPGSGKWTMGALNSGETATLQITALVDLGTDGDTLTTPAFVLSLDQIDPNPANDSTAVSVIVQSADLAVTTSVDDATPGVGDTISFQLVLENLGPTAATNVTVVDVLEAGLVQLTSSVTSGSYIPGTRTWTLGSLTAGSADTLTITARVAVGTAGQTLHYGGSVTASDQSDPNAGNNSDETLVVVDAADLQVTKSVSDSNPAVGDPLRYTVLCVNVGDQEASSIQLIDALPSGVTFLADSSSQGSYDSGSGRWLLGALASGDSATLWLDVDVDAGTAGTSIANTAYLESSTPPDSSAVSDTSTVSIDVQGADLEVTKTVNNPIPNEGSSIIYTVVATNHGPTATTGVIVNDVLPVGVTFVIDTPSQGTYDSGTGIWSVGPLGVDSVATLALLATVDPGTGGTTITNTASSGGSAIADENAANDVMSADIEVQAADLGVSKTVNNPIPPVGATIAYTLIVNNAGPDSATSVVLSDALPSGVTYESSAPGQGFYDAGNGLWTVGTIAASGFATLSIVATVDAGTEGRTIWNVAQIAGVDQVDPAMGNEADSASIVVPGVAPVDQADLLVSVSADDANPGEGETVHYTVLLSNAGPDGAIGIEVTDAVPAGLTFVSATPTQGSYGSGTGVWTVGALSNGSSVSLDLEVTVDAETAGESIRNTAAVSASGTVDPNAGNSTDFADVLVRNADLALAVIVNDIAPNEGDVVTFTVTVVNAGPDSTLSVSVSDLLPAGLTYAGDTPDRGTYASGPGLWTIGTMTAPDTVSLALMAAVDLGTAGSTISNIASIATSAEADSNSTNDTGFAEVSVQVTDLVVNKTVDDATPDEGNPVTYTVTVRNAGPDDATNVSVTDLLPAGLTYSGDAPSQGSYASGTGLWTIGTLAAADSASLDLSAIVDLGTNGTTITNVASIAASDVADTTSSNDTDSVDIDVTLITGITLAGTQNFSTANPGDTNVLLFTISVANSDPTSVMLTDLALDNVAAGPGTPPELDADYGLLTLYRDNGNGTFEPGSDTPIAQASMIAGQVAFSGLSQATPQGAIYSLHVAGGPSLVARDSDVLDLQIGTSGSVTFDQAVTFVNAFPVAAAGGVTVDGMVSAQISVVAIPDAAAVAGTKVLAYEAVLPANGYAADMLSGLNLRNAGDAIGTTDYMLELWTDGGNGTWDDGVGDDVLVGPCTDLGGLWNCAALSEAIPAAGLHFFAVASIAGGATDGRTIEITIPVGGVTVVSDNDGPLDAATPSSGRLTVQPAPSDIVIEVLLQGSSTIIPAGDNGTVFRFRLFNNGSGPETLERVTLTNASTGAPDATQDELDASWGPVTLSLDRPDDVGAFGRATTAFVNGIATFSGLDEIIAPGDSVLFTAYAAASSSARDGDFLDVSIPDITAFAFSQVVNMIGTFPLDPAGIFVVNGSGAGQFIVGPVDPTLLTGEQRRVSMDVTVPSNGYEADTMLRLDVVNLGTAESGTDITRVELWADDGDGTFDETTDSNLGELTYTGDRWERTGLAQLIPTPSGLQLFVTTDIADFATAGRTVRLAIPGPPDEGLGVASNNDGPQDESVVSPTQTISTVDRVSITPIAIAPAPVVPGAAEVLLAGLSAENSYSVDKTLTMLRVTNLASGAGTQAQLDATIELLTLWIDDGNGTFEGAPADTAVATDFFDTAQATFAGLAWNLPAGATRRLWVSANLSLTAAPDGVVIGAEVSSQSDVSFSDVTALAAGFPLDSGARWTVDGFVAAQVTNLAAPGATLGPDEGPVLALDFGLPGNGYLGDELNGISVVNLGTALTSDLSDVRLWRDGGDGSFDAGAGDDADLGAMAFVGGRWILPTLTESLPAGSTRFFVAVRASSSPTDSATVRLAIPTDGVEMASANDGPIDTAVANPNVVLLSTAVLLASLDISPTASTVDSTVTVTMTVRNLHPSATVDSIIPSTLSPSGLGVLTYVSGPTPAMLSLAPLGQSTLSWTYRAQSSGQMQLTGSTDGVEQGSGIPHASLPVTSNVHQIFVQAQDLDVFAVESMPFSISRGQQGVVPIALTFSNPAGAGGSDIRLLGFRVRLEDEFGGDVVPADLLARVVVNEGAVVYLDKGAIETTGSEIDLTLAQPVLIESAGSSSSATLGIALDISDTTSVPNFRLQIVDATWFQAEDATSGGPVNISLLDPPAFPIASGLARVVAEATRVDVAAVPASDFAVGQGQGDAPALDLLLLNPDPSGLAADARVTTFAVSLVDTAGAVIPDPSEWIDAIRVDGPVQNYLTRPLTPEDGATIQLDLATLISLPVETPVPLSVAVDVDSTAAIGSFRLVLADSSLFDARDANTGAPLPPIYATNPVAGPLVSVEAPADSAWVSGTPSVPPSIAVGTQFVHALTVTLSHPGPVDAAPVLVQSLTLQTRDGASQPLVPATYVDRVDVKVDTTSVAVVTSIPSTGNEIPVPLNGVTIDPFESVSLAIHFDSEVTAPASLFAITIASDGVYAVDANLLTPVMVTPEPGTEFPLTSGVTQLQAPARELVVGMVDLMPAVLVADGRKVDVAEITLHNPAEATAGDIRVDRLRLKASDRDGMPLDLGAAVLSIEAWGSDSIWATSAILAETDAEALLGPVAELSIAPGQTVTLALTMTLRDEQLVEGFRIGLDEVGVGVVQPGGSLLTVAVLPDEGSVFPLWTESGNFSGTTLRDSYSNFPNPFAAGRQSTAIAFYLPQAGRVSLKVHTLRGETVRTLLVDAPLAAGLHQDTLWDGRNGRGDVVLNGVYLTEITVRFDDGSSERILRKIAVVR